MDRELNESVGGSGATGLEGLSDDHVKDLRQTLRHQIDHMAQRIEYTESRLRALALVAAALVAAGLALLQVVLTQFESLAAEAPLGILASSFVLIGLTMWYAYALQTNYPYPFVKVATTWKWFYHYALKKEAFTADWYRHPSKESKKKGEQAYESQWQEFRSRGVTDLTNLRIDTLQDLEQVFLLHVNERYKNLFLTHLRQILHRGIVAAVILALVGFVVALALDLTVLSDDAPMSSPASGTHAAGGVVVEASWRATGDSRVSGVGGEEVRLLVNAKIENRGESALSAATLIAKDNVGMFLPIFVESATPQPLNIPAGSSVDAVALVWIPAAVSRDLHHFELDE